MARVLSVPGVRRRAREGGTMSGNRLGYPPRREPTQSTTAAPTFLSPQTEKRVTDRRYRTQRWKRARLRVLNRDGWMCRIVTGCDTRATVADHIIPVSAEMPDGLFYGLANLRAACRDHNLARGFADRLRSEVTTSTAVVTKDYSK
jgi:5-methylcytosine-specific restriction endonuclease McrA